MKNDKKIKLHTQETLTEKLNLGEDKRSKAGEWSANGFAVS